MSLFDDKLLEDHDDDALMQMAQTVRVRTLVNTVDSGNALSNTMDNRMLLNDISSGAAARIKLRQNEKSLDNQAHNAILVAQVLESVTGRNPFEGGGEHVGEIIDANFEEAFPEDIDPDTLTLGNQRLSLEDANIDEGLL